MGRKRGPAAKSTIVRTAGEVATHFGVAERTARAWFAGGCPGEPGKYDLAAIAAWREGRKSADAAAGDSPRHKYHAARAERELLRLAKDRGELVQADAVRRLLVRHIHEAKAILAQLPDRVAAALPAKTERAARRKLRDEAARTVDDACRSLADMLTAAEAGGKTEAP